MPPSLSAAGTAGLSAPTATSICFCAIPQPTDGPTMFTAPFTPCPTTVSGGGATLGNIGYGYIYPQFNAQLRYTTPDMHGFKQAVAIHTPARSMAQASDWIQTFTTHPPLKPTLRVGTTNVPVPAPMPTATKPLNSGSAVCTRIQNSTMPAPMMATLPPGVQVGYKAYELVASAIYR